MQLSPTTMTFMITTIDYRLDKSDDHGDKDDKEGRYAGRLGIPSEHPGTETSETLGFRSFGKMVNREQRCWKEYHPLASWVKPHERFAAR